MILLGSGETDRAQGYFQEMIDKDKNVPLAYVGLARVFTAKKQYPEALALLEKVLAQNDQEIAAEAQFLIGEVYRSQQDCQSAVIAYLKVKYLYGSAVSWVAQSLFHAAECNERLERLADARRLYNSIITEYASEKDLAEKAQQRLKALLGA